VRRSQHLAELRAEDGALETTDFQHAELGSLAASNVRLPAIRLNGIRLEQLAARRRVLSWCAIGAGAVIVGFQIARQQRHHCCAVPFGRADDAA
jgi:hypothetical protein